MLVIPQLSPFPRYTQLVWLADQVTDGGRGVRNEGKEMKGGKGEMDSCHAKDIRDYISLSPASLGGECYSTHVELPSVALSGLCVQLIQTTICM